MLTAVVRDLGCGERGCHAQLLRWLFRMFHDFYEHLALTVTITLRVYLCDDSMPWHGLVLLACERVLLD